MNILCVDPAQVHKVWPLVSPLIVRALDKGSNGSEDIGEVEAAVLAGQMLVWLAVDEIKIWAAAVTSLHAAQNRKFCTIMACGGEDREKWLPLLAELEKFGRDEGCDTMRIYGRRGWARVFPEYKLTRVMLEKRL